jgi:tRNA(Ile)-lysidine synthase
VPAVVEREDVRGFAGAGRSLEEAARLLRYRFLIRIAREYKTDAIATGHTADDQAETVLMHFLRGAGVGGLRGMLPATPLDRWAGIPGGAGIKLVRPLLEVDREQTESYCAAVGLEPRQDPSNLDPGYFRNRLRHHLLPLLETYNPGIRRILTRVGRVMTAEAALVSELVESTWPHVLREAGEGAVAFKLEAFRHQPLALQRALLREAILSLRPTLRDVGFEAVERGVQFALQPDGPKRQALVGGLELIHSGEEVVLREPGASVTFPHFAQLTSDRRRRLSVPGRARLASGWRLEVTQERVTTSTRPALLDERSGRVAALDAGRLQGPLWLRPAKAGDRIRPLGMAGTTKVAELLVNQHIPLLARARWPLVLAGDQVVWVMGLRMAHDVRLTRESREAVVLRLISPEGDRP